MARPIVEIFSFQGCANRKAALALVREVADELGVEPELRLVQVEPEDVEAARFIGSPSIRVNGRDVEPGADSRTDYVYACRLYGRSGVPERAWVERALQSAS